MDQDLPGKELMETSGLAEQYRLQLLDHVSELVWSLSPDGQRVTYFNQAASAVFGAAFSEVARRDGLWLGAVHPEDKVFMREQLLEIGETGGFQHQFRVLESDGSERQLSASFLPLKDERGETAMIAVMAQDSSENFRVQRSLTEARAVYDSLIESLPIKVVRKNRHGRFVFCNRTFCDALGLSLEEIIGKTDEDLFPHHVAKKYRDDDRQIIESGQAYHAVEEHPLADGTLSWVEVIKSPLRDRDGRRVGIQGVFWDVTDRILAQQKMEQARLLAESASKSRGDFLANVSHEIRTPMNGIIGLTELLLDVVENRTQREYLAMIRQSADGLMTLINDILDFSKIESGKLELDVNRFDLRSCIGQAVRTLAVRAHAKGLELVYDFDPAIPEEVIGDAGRLRQVITNLVGNAVKFTEQGHVIVRATNIPSGGDRASVLISVEDTGIGIAPEKFDQVFREFEQADSSTTRKYGGSGLGLAITRQLLQIMGSKIQLESQPRKGSRFYFRIDFPVATMSEDEVDSFHLTLNGVRALVVDDHPAAAFATQRMLKQLQMPVEVCHTGTDGLLRLEQLGLSGKLVNVILLDDSLPDLSPNEFVAQMRELKLPGDVAPPVAVLSVFQPLSGTPTETDVDRLHKPLMFEEVENTLTAMLGLSSQQSSLPGSDVAQPKTTKRLRVLLAEDNAVNQRVAMALLQKMGCAVTVAANGQEAVDMVEAHRYELVLMDVQMPVMDGLEATRQIRMLKGAAGRTRIIGLSAHAGSVYREACLSAGMDEYIAKPMRRDELRQHVDSVRNPGSKVSSDSRRAKVVHSVVIDWSVAMETVGGDRKLLGEIINVFLEDSPRQLQNMELAIAAADTVSLRRQAHSIRGALSYLGATAAVSKAAELERIALSDDLNGAEDARKELLAEIEQLTSELAGFKNQ